VPTHSYMSCIRACLIVGPAEAGACPAFCSAQLTFVIAYSKTLLISARCVPPAELPECPQLWPRLVALDLSHNSLGGAVPEAALASMTALRTLDMSFQARTVYSTLSAPKHAHSSACTSH
jgi:hypothetical protein